MSTMTSLAICYVIRSSLGVWTFVFTTEAVTRTNSPRSRNSAEASRVVGLNLMSGVKASVICLHAQASLSLTPNESQIKRDQTWPACLRMVVSSPCQYPLLYTYGGSTLHILKYDPYPLRGSGPDFLEETEALARR